MALKGSGRGKLAEFVANHVLCDIYRNMLAAVVDRDGVAYEIREDNGSSAFRTPYLPFLRFTMNLSERLWWARVL